MSFWIPNLTGSNYTLNQIHNYQYCSSDYHEAHQYIPINSTDHEFQLENRPVFYVRHRIVSYIINEQITIPLSKNQKNGLCDTSLIYDPKVWELTPEERDNLNKSKLKQKNQIKPNLSKDIRPLLLISENIKKPKQKKRFTKKNSNKICFDFLSIAP